MKQIHRPWTTDEIDTLRTLSAEGMSWRDISCICGRTEKAIKAMAHKCSIYGIKRKEPAPRMPWPDHDPWPAAVRFDALKMKPARTVDCRHVRVQW